MKNLRAPKHWEKDGLVPILLSPFSSFYAKATARRLQRSGYRPKSKVICIGNVVAGGAGKTPVAITIAKMLQQAGKNVHFISTGYGRQSENIGIVRVKAQAATEVGDEPILLAQIAPTWVGESRAELARAAENAGADVIIMDDGFQNAEVEKDFSIIVVDGGYGYGNNRVIPAGPLREPVAAAYQRADAILVVGKQAKQLPPSALPHFKAHLEIDIPIDVKDEEVVAFCGIGRPEKFFESLRSRNVVIAEELAFPDHHFYNDMDFKAIFGIANSKQAVVVTTTKDMVKVPERFRKIIYPIKAELKIAGEDKFADLLLDKINK